MNRERIADTIQEAIETHEDGLLKREEYLAIADRIIAEEGKELPEKTQGECLNATMNRELQQPKLPEKWDMEFSLTIHDIATKQNEILDYLKAREEK